MARVHDISREKILGLLEMAILAPSTHNTQPWRFRIQGSTVHVETDSSRWLRVADPDKRELFLSVGCAIENLLVAAEHFGLGYRLRYPDRAQAPDVAVRIEIVAQKSTSSFRHPSLFEAIAARHTDRKPYRHTPLRTEDLAALQNCVVEEDLQLVVCSNPRTLNIVDEYSQLADAIQFADPAYRDEIGFWIGQGAYGTPWLLSKLGQLAISQVHRGKLLEKREGEALLGASLFAAICSRRDDCTSHIKSGQALERVWLRATSLGIGIQPLSQIVEVPALRVQLGALLGNEAEFVQQPFRLGYSNRGGKSPPRRALKEFLLAP